MPSRTISRTVLDDLCHRVKWLEVAIMRLQNKRTVTIGVYASGHVPQDLGDGVLYFTSDTHKFVMRIDGHSYQANTIIL